MFFRKCTSNRNEKLKAKISKPVYLGLSIIETNKTLMHEFWCDHIKPKYPSNEFLCYMDIDSFTMNIETEDVYEDIASDVEKRFDTSNYAIERPLLTGKNKKVIGLIKDELGGKIMTEFVGQRQKTYSYLVDHDNGDKKSKETKKCIIIQVLSLKTTKNVNKTTKPY